MLVSLRRLTLLAVAALGLLLACGPACDRQAETAVPLRVVVGPFLTNAPFFIAAEEGYFAAQGLRVEFINMVNSAHAVPALAEGEVDVLSSAIRVNLLNAIARGAEIKFVADLGRVRAGDCTARAFLAHPALLASGALADPSDLAGRRISADPAFYSGYVLERLLARGGLTLDDVELVGLSSPTEPGALENGSVDVVTSVEPWITRMVSAGQAAVWIAIEDVVPVFQVSTVVFGPTLLGADPEAGERFLIAYLQGVRQYNEGKTPRNLEILAKHTGLDPELLARCCWTPITADGRIDLASMLEYQRWMVGKGFLDRVLDEEAYWDPRLVDRACRALDESQP
jgi:NitT/TauT family transport system substrate-binding protein